MNKNSIIKAKDEEINKKDIIIDRLKEQLYDAEDNSINAGKVITISAVTMVLFMVFVTGGFNVLFYNTDHVSTLNHSTLDEVCNLFQEGYKFDIENSTNEQIVCVPVIPVTEKVLDDGAIVLKDYKKEEK